MNEYQIKFEKFEKARLEFENAQKDLHEFDALSVLPKEKYDKVYSLIKTNILISETYHEIYKQSETAHNEINSYILELEKEYGLDCWNIFENVNRRVENDLEKEKLDGKKE